MKKLILLSIYLCFFKLSAQQAGDLDTSFAQNGKGVTNIGETKSTIYINSQVVQSDGKIILAGKILYEGFTKGYLKRINSDGTDDITFSNNSSLISSLTTEFRKVKIQSDNRITVCFDNKILRLNNDGSVDSSFGNNGFFNNPIGYLVNDYELLSDGKILVLTSTSIYQNYFYYVLFKLYKYHINGELDSNFITNSFQYLAPSNGIYVFTSIYIREDQKIIIGINKASSQFGSTNYDHCLFRLDNDGNNNQIISCLGSGLFDVLLLPNNKMLVARQNGIYKYNQDLTLDTSFGLNGFVPIIPSGNVYKIKTQQNNKIIAAINRKNSGISTSDVLLASYNENGSLNTSFNGNGIYVLPTSLNYHGLFCLDIYNSEIIISSMSNTDSTSNTMVSKTTNNGVLEPLFDNDGQKLIIENIDSNDTVLKSFVQSDGKILLCGKKSTKVVAIVRYNVDGSVDTTYGDQGKFIYNLVYESYLDFEIQTDDKVVMLLDKSFIRIDNNGIIDNSFGVNGVQNVVIPVFNSQYNFNLNDFQILPDNKIIAVGKYDGNYNNFSTIYGVLIKLNYDGSFDINFNNSGYIIHDVYSGSSYEEFYTINTQNDGKIIIGGKSFNSYQRNTIARFNSDGTKDLSFGTDGVFVLNDFTINTNYNYRINSIDLQTDGKIIINSFVNTGSVANSFLLGRVNPNGTLDTSFGTNGIVQTPIENSCNSNVVKVLPNQKILAIGYSTGSSTNFAMAKYNTDGSLDTSFGNQGKVTTSFLGNASASSLVLTNDNKVIVSGTAINTLFGTNDFAYAKYHLESSLGIEENNPSNTILLFPNPAQNIITFNQEVKTVSLYTLDGKLLNTQLVNNQIDLSGFNPGIYLVRGTNNNGVSFSEKLIKN